LLQYNVTFAQIHAAPEKMSDVKADSPSIASVVKMDALESTIDIESGRGSESSPFAKRKGKTLKWENLSFAIKGKGDSKVILNNLWGEVPVGQVCCILGPSGAGKSSLLNVLCGRLAQGGKNEISGNITMEGQTIDPTDLSFKRSVAYVMQDDACWPTLTCRESLQVAATLRIPGSVSKEAKEKLVDNIISELGLTECADTLCGGELVKGLSGGEKKRTCIGLELISSPALVFLDEPTSGLDSHSASQCVELLRKVSRAGSAILCTIHQPSSEVFQLFDSCILLKSGRIVFQGPTSTINAHFKSIGLPVPMNYNPADHVMSVVQKHTIAELEERNALMGRPDMPVRKQSSFELGEGQPQMEPQAHAGFFQQLRILVWREFMNVRRDPGVMIGRFGITGTLNLIMGLIFFGAGNKNDMLPENLQSHFGALTFVTISAMFGNAQATLLTFPFEKPVFLREYSTGMYNATAYTTSKILAEIPLCFLQCLWGMLIIYWMVDLQGNFVGHVCAQWLLGLAASSVAMLIGAAAPDVKTATEMAPGMLVPQLMFAGFFIRIDQIPVYLRWAQYLCSLKYALNLAVIVEFGKDTCSSEITGCQKILETNDVVESDWWVYVVVLLALFAAFRLLAINVLVKTAKKFY
jgi:ABC-type multidrug transport system ATPase subunit